ncbi:MAG: hypothetical protein JWR26_338 [Pedosphaera sp.]|nr:hypothetical protein [Pedosphaera sp.]
MKDLKKLFLNELKYMYDGENQLVEALPKMVKNAECRELKDTFNEHLVQTRTHVIRLEQVFRAMGQEPERKSCKGLEGIIDEGESFVREFEENSALNAGLITAGQKAEHYEITSYGSLCTWAKQIIATEEVINLLEANLGDEKETDDKLTQLAQEICNIEASLHDSARRGRGSSLLSKTLGSDRQATSHVD